MSPFEPQGPSVHASVVAMPTGGVMMLGPSRSGKSSLALAMIRQKNATLVADDRTYIAVNEAGKLMASVPETIAGLLELRGMGILQIGTQGQIPPPVEIVLAVELVPRMDVPRLPTPGYLPSLNGLRYDDVPLLRLHAFDAQTPEIITLALATIGQSGFTDDAILRD